MIQYQLFLCNKKFLRNPYYIKNSLRSKDVQLAEMKLLLCSPLARGVCVKTHTIFKPGTTPEDSEDTPETGDKGFGLWGISFLLSVLTLVVIHGRKRYSMRIRRR